MDGQAALDSGCAADPDRGGGICALSFSVEGLHVWKLRSILASNQGYSRGIKRQFIAAIHDALYASKIVSYAQGYMLLKSAEEEYGWQLP